MPCGLLGRFDKVTWLSTKGVSSTWGSGPNGLLSKCCIYCSDLINIDAKIFRVMWPWNNYVTSVWEKCTMNVVSVLAVQFNDHILSIIVDIKVFQSYVTTQHHQQLKMNALWAPIQEVNLLFKFHDSNMSITRIKRFVKVSRPHSKKSAIRKE